MPKLILLISIFLMLGSPVRAETQNTDTGTLTTSSAFTVDDSKLDVPTPPGFVTTSEKVPALITIFQQYFPPGTNLLEVYATQAELDALMAGKQDDVKQYFVIMQPAGMQKKSFSKRDFSEIAEVLAKEGSALLENGVAGQVEANVNRGNASLSKMVDEKVDIKLSKVGFLGVFRNDENSVAFSIRAEVSSGEKGQKDTVVNSSAMLLLGDKIIMIAAYASEYDAKSKVSGVNWTQAEVAKWSDAILQANANSTKVE